MEAVMISKCANPSCSARFLYLHTGKLFRFELEAKDDEGPQLGRKHSRGIEFYWLCENCSAEMTLVYRKGSGVTIQPLSADYPAAS